MTDITRRLRGRRVAEVVTNGHVLQIRADDGTDLNIAWVDDNGVPIKGRPVVAQHGVRLEAKGMQDLILLRNPIHNIPKERCNG